MEGYRPILYSISLLVAWWTHASLSFPSITSDPLRFIFLMLSTAWMFYFVITSHKQKHYLKAGFVACYSLLPWAMFLQLCFISDAPGLKHALVIYNLFRYLLILLNFIIFTKLFFKAVSDL